MLGTDLGVEPGRVVEAFLLVVLGGWVAAPLLGEHVHHDRAVGVVGRVAQRLLERFDVVAVEWAGVADPEGLEERGRLDHVAQAGERPLDAPGEMVSHDGHVAHDPRHLRPLAQVGRVHPEPCDAFGDA